MNLSFLLLFLHLWSNVEISVSQHACSKLPDVPHANVQYKEGDMVHFTCEPGYSSAQDSKYMCTSNGWLTLSQGKCFSCSTLPEVPHAHVSEETKKSDYQLGDVIHFSCESGYASSPAIKYVCSNDGWLAVSQGTCQSSSQLGCGAPPSLQGGDTTEFPKKQYSHNERVEYSCYNLYTMVGEGFKTCKNGEWTGEMRCLQACTVDEDLMNVRNIQFKYSHETKLYAPHGESIEFSCTRGRRRGSVEMRQKCNDGVIDLPNCY